MFPILRFVGFAVLFQIAAIGVAGQDLGSSNKLFGRKPPAKAKTPPKKAAPKKAAPKRTTPVAAKRTTPVKKTPETQADRARQVTAKDKAPIVEITRSRTTPQSDANSAANNRRFEQLIETGNNARDERNYSAAESAYRNANTLKPSDARALYGLGNLASDQQRWDVAEEHYKSALSLEPENTFTMIALSYVLTQPIALPDLGARYEEAERLARRAIELSPSNALGYDQLGVAREMRGFISAETESAYRRAIQLDPQFAPAHAHLGRLLRRRGLTREAENSYQKAITLSNDVATAILVAEVMQSELRFKESEALLRRAINEDPKNPAALLLIGRALTALESFAEAEVFLRRSLNAGNNSFIANSLLGDLYLRQNKLESAENALLQATRFVPAYERRRLSQQFESVGDAYTKAGKPQNAERSYRQALTLDPDRESLSGKISRVRAV